METIKTPEKTNLGEIPSFVPSPASLQIEFNPCFFHMCHGQKSRFLGDGRPPTFNNGILIMGPYKPLLLGWWVYPLLYGNVMGVDRPDRTYTPQKFNNPPNWKGDQNKERIEPQPNASIKPPHFSVSRCIHFGWAVRDPWFNLFLVGGFSPTHLKNMGQNGFIFPK